MSASLTRAAGSSEEPGAAVEHADGVTTAGMTVYTAGYQVFKQNDPAKKAAVSAFLAFIADPKYEKPAA